MSKIATHNSATGEPAYGWLSKLIAPFAVTQLKTIKEQLNIGVRYFDIRVRKTKRGWVCAHGLWESSTLAEDILKELNDFGATDSIYANVTNEGFGNDEYLSTIDNWVSTYSNIHFVAINIKYGKMLKWENVKQLNQVPGGAIDKFYKLNLKDWYTYILCPLAYKYLKKEEVIFDDSTYQFVDFI